MTVVRIYQRLSSFIRGYGHDRSRTVTASLVPGDVQPGQVKSMNSHLSGNWRILISLVLISTSERGNPLETHQGLNRPTGTHRDRTTERNTP